MPTLSTPARDTEANQLPHSLAVCEMHESQVQSMKTGNEADGAQVVLDHKTIENFNHSECMLLSLVTSLTQCIHSRMEHLRPLCV